MEHDDITVTPLAKSPISPRTGIQPAATIRRWTWWRIAAVMLATFLAACVISDSVATLTGIEFQLMDAIYKIVAPETPTQGQEKSQFIVQIMFDLVASAVIVALLWAVAGRRAVGVHHRAPGESMLAVGAAVRGPYLVALAMTLIGSVPAIISGPGDVVSSSTDAGAPAWLMVLHLTRAGIAEEIALTVLPYWLLEQVRTRSGTPVAHTGLGAALIVAVWWALHITRAGLLPVDLILVFYLKVMIWRHSKHLAVLIGLHVGWNLWLHLLKNVQPDVYDLPIYCTGFIIVGLVALREKGIAPSGTLPATQDRSASAADQQKGEY